MLVTELHSKFYADEDDETHMLAFLRAQRAARLHNEAFARGEVNFKLDAWGPLADLTSVEYKQRNGYSVILLHCLLPRII